MKHNGKLGIVLEHFSEDFVSRKATLEELIKLTARLGYHGLEFTPAQMVPSYPNVSDRDIEQIRELLLKYQLEPYCLNIYLDTGAVTGRELSENELYKAVLQNLIYGKKAGFQVIKTTKAITAGVLHKVLPLCRDLDMKLAIELEITDSLDWENAATQEFIRLIRGEGQGQAGVMLELEALSYLAVMAPDWTEFVCGIYTQPEALLLHQDLLKTVVASGYSNYLICRKERKVSFKAQTEAEQFLKNYYGWVENYDHEKN